MMAFLDATAIQEAFFFAVRFIVALAGFAIGYFLTGPIVQTVAWLVRRRQLPDWVVAWLRVAVGLLLALLIFYTLPLGGEGWGGRGSGGGEGDSKGSGKSSPGLTTSSTGMSTSKGSAATDIGPSAKRQLLVDLLGGTTVKDDRCFRIDGKDPPINFKSLEEYIAMHKAEIASIKIVITEESVSRSDPLVTQVRNAAEKLGIPTLGPVENSK
jgi:hypothetical protein